MSSDASLACALESHWYFHFGYRPVGRSFGWYSTLRIKLDHELDYLLPNAFFHGSIVASKLNASNLLEELILYYYSYAVAPFNYTCSFYQLLFIEVMPLNAINVTFDANRRSCIKAFSSILTNGFRSCSKDPHRHCSRSPSGSKVQLTHYLTTRVNTTSSICCIDSEQMSDLYTCLIPASEIATTQSFQQRYPVVHVSSFPVHQL